MIKTITSASHPVIKRLIKLRSQRKFRYEQKRLILESSKEILEYSKPLLNVLSCREEDFITFKRAKNSYFVPYELIKKIAGSKTPEGVIAEIDMPLLELSKEWEAFPMILALEKIQDPGNLGTLIRSALAFNWQGIYLLPGCCDPFNDKAIRASKGAVLKAKITQGSWDQLELFLKDQKRELLVADMGGGPPKKYNSALLVLGSEGMGVSQKALSICQKVSIPMGDETESLNVAVAGSILMAAIPEKLPLLFSNSN